MASAILGAAGISAGGSVLSSIMGNTTQLMNTASIIDANKEQTKMQIQGNKDLAAINLQNTKDINVFNNNLTRNNMAWMQGQITALGGDPLIAYGGAAEKYKTQLRGTNMQTVSSPLQVNTKDLPYQWSHSGNYNSVVNVSTGKDKESKYVFNPDTKLGTGLNTNIMPRLSTSSSDSISRYNRVNNIDVIKDPYV